MSERSLIDEVADCTCVEWCSQGDEPCSKNGRQHAHHEPCPVHPDAEVTG